MTMKTLPLDCNIIEAYLTAIIIFVVVVGIVELWTKIRSNKRW